MLPQIPMVKLPLDTGGDCQVELLQSGLVGGVGYLMGGLTPHILGVELDGIDLFQHIL